MLPWDDAVGAGLAMSTLEYLGANSAVVCCGKSKPRRQKGKKEEKERKKEKCPCRGLSEIVAKELAASVCIHPLRNGSTLNTPRRYPLTPKRREITEVRRIHHESTESSDNYYIPGFVRTVTFCTQRDPVLLFKLPRIPPATKGASFLKKKIKGVAAVILGISQKTPLEVPR